ncbi:hypothetical protein NIES39_R01030 [Arthrospira platensis NIES-39]|nr:hypothetical protein NIES39_R01030 [Arthrospira platensis NIES-39]
MIYIGLYISKEDTRYRYSNCICQNDCFKDIMVFDAVKNCISDPYLTLNH